MNRAHADQSADPNPLSQLLRPKDLGGKSAPAVGGANVASTVFLFQHKVFQAPGAVFRKDRTSGVVLFHVALGGVVASINLSQIAKTFAIGAHPPDGHMLRLVEKGLSCVGEIRPGDSIPNELIDGSASWSVERRHYDRARSKILVQLVKWMTEGNSTIAAGVDVLKLIETPEVRNKITEALGSATRQLGIDEGDRAAVPGMIAHLTGELAQIEALREKIAGYLAIEKKLNTMAAVYRGDVRYSDTIKRVAALIAQPLSALRRQFQAVEAHTAEIMSSLRQLSGTVQFIRRVRDELREFVLLWGDLDTAWHEVLIARGREADALIGRTYRFAATHYLLTQSWAGNSHRDAE